jgi:hypothetical protein
LLNKNGPSACRCQRLQPFSRWSLRADLSCDRHRVTAMDCGKARFLERPQGIPVLPAARLGIMESGRTRPRTPVIRIGPAGWKYKDWEGMVYPQPAPRGFDPLAYIADYFSTVEINSSYYGPRNRRRHVDGSTASVTIATFASPRSCSTRSRMSASQRRLTSETSKQE